MADGGAHSSLVPARSLEQRLSALARANEVRRGRAQLKRALREGRLGILELLAEPPELARTAKVAELLVAVPKLGRARVARLLVQCRISETKTLAGLSERQRAELAERLRHTGAEGDAPTARRG